MSKVLRDQGPDLAAWKAPTVYDDSRHEVRHLSPQDVENIEKQAHSKGFEVGRWEGLQEGHKKIEEQVGQLKQLITALTRPFAQLNQDIENELVLLAASIAEQIVQQEISVNPQLIELAVQQAAGAIATADREVHLHVHPEDAALLRANMEDSAASQSWRLVEDNSIRRGDCRVESSEQFVDASVHARVTALIDQAFAAKMESAE